MRMIVAGQSSPTITVGSYNVIRPDHPNTVYQIIPPTAAVLNSAAGLVAQPNNGKLIGGVWNYNPSARGDSLWCKFAVPYQMPLPSDFTTVAAGVGHGGAGRILCRFPKPSLSVTGINHVPMGQEDNTFGEFWVDAIFDPYDPTTLTFGNSPPVWSQSATQADLVTPDPYQIRDNTGDSPLAKILSRMENAVNQNADNSADAVIDSLQYVAGTQYGGSPMLLSASNPSSLSTFTIPLPAYAPLRAGYIARLVGRSFQFTGSTFFSLGGATRVITSITDNGDGTGLAAFAGPISMTLAGYTFLVALKIYGMTLSLDSTTTQEDATAPTAPYYGTIQATITPSVKAIPIGFDP